MVGGCWWYTYPSEKYESQLGWIIPNIWKINVPNHQPDKVIIELKLVNAVNGQNCKSKMEPKKHVFGVYSIHIKFRGIRYWGIGRFLTCRGDGFLFVPTSDFTWQIANVNSITGGFAGHPSVWGASIFGSLIGVFGDPSVNVVS